MRALDRREPTPIRADDVVFNHGSSEGCTFLSCSPLGNALSNLGMGVIINELANLPHHDGECVLHCVRPNFEVRILRSRDEYWIHGAASRLSGATWTTIMAPRKTVRDASELGRRVWAEGEDFKVTVGKPFNESR